MTFIMMKASRRATTIVISASIAISIDRLSSTSADSVSSEKMWYCYKWMKHFWLPSSGGWIHSKPDGVLAGLQSNVPQMSYRKSNIGKSNNQTWVPVTRRVTNTAGRRRRPLTIETWWWLCAYQCESALTFVFNGTIHFTAEHDAKNNGVRL